MCARSIASASVMSGDMLRARPGGQGRAYRGCAAPVAAYLFLPPELLPPLPFPPPLDEDLPPPELLPLLSFPPPLDADLPPPELLPPLSFPPPLDADLPPPELLPLLSLPPPLDADLPLPELSAALPTLSDVFFGEAVARAAFVLVAAGSGDRRAESAFETDGEAA